MIAADRHGTSRHTIRFVGDCIRGQFVIRTSCRGKRFVLILREEGSFILELQIHGMLNGGGLVMIESLRPGNRSTEVHGFSIGDIKLCRQANVTVLP